MNDRMDKARRNKAPCECQLHCAGGAGNSNKYHHDIKQDWQGQQIVIMLTELRYPAGRRFALVEFEIGSVGITGFHRIQSGFTHPDAHADC